MRILLSAFLAMLLVGSATGREPDLVAAIQSERVAGGDATSVGASFGNQLIIEAGDADSRATLNISDFFTDGTRTRRYRFKATAPLDRDKADSVDMVRCPASARERRQRPSSGGGTGGRRGRRASTCSIDSAMT